MPSGSLLGEEPKAMVAHTCGDPQGQHNRCHSAKTRALCKKLAKHSRGPAANRHRARRVNEGLARGLRCRHGAVMLLGASSRSWAPCLQRCVTSSRGSGRL